MRDKCLEINKEENFLHIIDHKAYMSDQQSTLDTTASPNEKIRRITMYVDQREPYNYPLSKVSLSRRTLSLRYLVFFPGSNESDQEDQDVGQWVIAICKDFQLLRILDFSRLPLKGGVPEQVGSLIFLRHLSLRNTHITELPSSIGNLKYLMILDLRVHDVNIKIPNELWKLKYLTHLYFPGRVLSQERLHRQGYEIKGGEMLKLEQLSKLEKVEDVDLDTVDVKGLVELRSMQKLQARCVFKKESLDPFINSKSIKKLSLKIHVNLVIEDPMALSACDSLKLLDIDGDRENCIYLPMRPKMYPQSLRHLAFWYCKFPEDPMPFLETLQNLRILALQVCYDGYELNCSEKGFPNLTYLKIDGLFWTRTWTIKKGGLPNLESMEIYNSPIQELPIVIPSHVDIACNPCVGGIERHGSCPFFKSK